ncbi:PE-PPE domain-containing protein [Saccharomonospora piscinae]|uniref:PE-PPE domain-containing protein n=1 Tax=Saccharomonospora piscinae TaxID=687388 RepID=UPI0004B198A7|nr:PE-PPE domain-containing protein [Saccharomonospora piscinae]
MRTVTTRALTALIAVLFAGLGAVAGAPGAGAAPVPDCPATMLFEVGGAGDGQGLVWDAVNAALPEAVEAEKIVYPAEMAPFPGHTRSMDESVAEGMATLGAAVRDVHARCAESDILVTGYSLGALVAGNALEALATDGAVAPERLRGVLYGDPRRPGDPSAGPNGSGDGGAGGVATTIPTFAAGLTLEAPRPDYGDVIVRQVCNQNDGICTSANPFTNALAFANGWAGYLSGDHRYDLDPLRDVALPDQFHRQSPKVPYGPPLPLDLPNPRELANGNPELSRQIVDQLRDGLRTALGPALWERLAERLPWLVRL